MQELKRVMLFCDWYEPARKAGGPIVSIANLVNNLYRHIHFEIITSAYDLGQTIPLSGILMDKETEIRPGSTITYLSRSRQSLIHLKKIISASKSSVVHLNSMFSYRFSLLPLLVSLTAKKEIILSPRGMLSKEALAIKPLKKRSYMMAFRFFSLHRKVRFHSTGQMETKDIQRAFGLNVIIHEIPNFAADIAATTARKIKTPGHLKVLYFGRIYPIKNVHLIPDWLAPFQRQVEVKIIGPVEDRNYWKLCEGKLKKLQINYTYEGEKSREEIIDYLNWAHLSVLPSDSENYGHAIVESLKAGVPVLTSNNVPWKHLKEAGCGANLQPEEKDKWRMEIKYMIELDNLSYDMMREKTSFYINELVNTSSIITSYTKLYMVKK